MDYSALINDIVPDCPGVPVPVAIRAIREAVRTFCKESTAYRKRLAPGDITYAAGVYTIAIPTGSQIETIVSPISYDDTDAHVDIYGASPEWLDVHYPGWRTDTRSDLPGYFVTLTTNTFRFTPEDGTNRTAQLGISLVLQPDRTTTMLDDEFGNRWFDTLVAGAKYLLLVMPKAEWSNPNLAAFYKDKFENGIVEAKRYVKTGLRNPRADGIAHVRAHYR